MEDAWVWESEGEYFGAEFVGEVREGCHVCCFFATVWND